MAAQFNNQSERAIITAVASTAVPPLHMLPPEGVNLFVVTSHQHSVDLRHLGGLAILLISVTPSMTTVLPNIEDHTTLFLIIMTHIAMTDYTDASLHDIRSVLSQKVVGKEHAIAYASCTFSISERKWSTFDRELYAIVWSVCHFHHYLPFHPFTIITDHKPLVGLKKFPLDQDPTGRRARWAVELDLHDWTVVHHDGTKHLKCRFHVPPPSQHFI
ncbi:hypothetical protein AOLI_G00126680 [Acnodon oligacanthus]